MRASERREQQDIRLNTDWDCDGHLKEDVNGLVHLARVSDLIRSRHIRDGAQAMRQREIEVEDRLARRCCDVGRPWARISEIGRRRISCIQSHRTSEDRLMDQMLDLALLTRGGRTNTHDLDEVESGLASLQCS